MTTAASVEIEPLSSTDFEAVAGWLATPAINRWLTPEWRERPANAVVLAIAVRNRRNRFFLVRYNGEPCGLVALSDIDRVDRTAMVWYALGQPQLSGKGITSEALRQLIRVGFDELELRSLHAWAMAQNQASIRILRKTGFREAGRLRQSACLDGEQTDRIYFDLISTEWRTSAGNGSAELAAP